MALWIDCQDRATLQVSPDGTLVALADRSGTGNDLSAVGSPKVVTDQAFTWLADFTAHDFLDCGKRMTFNEDRGFTVFLVAIPHPVPQGQANYSVACGDAITGHLAWELAACSAAGGYARLNAGHTELFSVSAVATIPDQLNAITVCSGRMNADGHDLACQTSGDHVVTIPYHDTGTDTFHAHVYVGTDPNNTNRPFFGEIAEVIVYDHALSDDEVATDRAVLERKYGITSK
jgi:hypothetical protein